MKSNCEWIIFHQWHKTFNDISWIWTLFHQVNFIIHENWMNHKRWNQIVNELYFINDIKLLMTFHGSKLISLSEFHHPDKFIIHLWNFILKKLVNGSSCNIHPLKIHKWYSMHVWTILECMDELQWDNGWPRWNQILIQLLKFIIIES